MVPLNPWNGELTEPVCPLEEWLLLSNKIGFRWTNEANRAYEFQALQSRLEADRQASICSSVALIGSVIVVSVVFALWLWLGQRM